MLELLSPAGSMDALRAAVQNGADAVYLGAGGFNARAGARNFTNAQLPEAVRYCHIRGVKVHFTLNTLVMDREMNAVAETLVTAARAGVDALIVQDLGVLDLCRQMAPGIPIHASTQMAIHSLEGVRTAAQLGVSRVVLARELDRDQIAYICRHSPVEIEVFVHGALCMSYSGQCYFSSLVGRRSGNRGRCAQPCRLNYGYGRTEDAYPLSLKDNCLVVFLDELDQMGVTSIKIEGRMKRAEYVAIATGIYRAAIDGQAPTTQDLRQLQAAFSRQGFTSGYYLGNTGRHMLGTRQDDQEDRRLFAAARATYERGEHPLVPVRFYGIFQTGSNAMLAVEDRDDHICKTAGPVVEPAKTAPLTQDTLTQQLSRTGGTPYTCTQVKAVIDRNANLSPGALNAMRREALDQLTALRGRVLEPELTAYHPAKRYEGPKTPPALTVSVTSASQLTRNLLAARPAVVYLPVGELLKHPQVLDRVDPATSVAVSLPRVVWDREWTELLGQLDRAYELGVRQALCGNLGQLSPAHSRGFALRGDFGLNLFNSRAMNLVRHEGLLSAAVSFELTLPQIRDLSKAVDTELIIYGRLPLMITENCIIRNRTGTCTCGGSVALVDRTGAQFPIQPDPGTCRSVVLNSRKLYLLDRQEALSNLGLWALRLMFTTETASQVDSVLRAWHSHDPMDPGSCTRGLYYRGVE